MYDNIRKRGAYVGAGALVPPPPCLGGGITQVGPGQYPQYTRAWLAREEVGSSLHRDHRTTATRPTTSPTHSKKEKKKTKKKGKKERETRKTKKKREKKGERKKERKKEKRIERKTRKTKKKRENKGERKKERKKERGVKGVPLPHLRTRDGSNN